jgi:hypothetical protein
VPKYLVAESKALGAAIADNRTKISSEVKVGESGNCNGEFEFNSSTVRMRNGSFPLINLLLFCPDVISFPIIALTDSTTRNSGLQFSAVVLYRSLIAALKDSSIVSAKELFKS